MPQINWHDRCTNTFNQKLLALFSVSSLCRNIFQLIILVGASPPLLYRSIDTQRTHTTIRHRYTQCCCWIEPVHTFHNRTHRMASLRQSTFDNHIFVFGTHSIPHGHILAGDNIFSSSRVDWQFLCCFRHRFFESERNDAREFEMRDAFWFRRCLLNIVRHFAVRPYSTNKVFASFDLLAKEIHFYLCDESTQTVDGCGVVVLSTDKWFNICSFGFFSSSFILRSMP